MRIVCPHCAAAYDVAPDLLTGRRMVRCVKCQQTWEVGSRQPEILSPTPTPPRPVAPLAPLPDLASTVIVGPALRERSIAEVSRSEPRPTALRLSWLASIVVLALAIGSAVLWRADIMRVWPPSTRLYAALHLSD